MRLLVVASMYPHPGHPYSGIFNQNCVDAAVQLGHEVTVLAPRPYVPPLLAVHPRWTAYAQIPRFAQRGTVVVHRPNLIQIPRIGTTFQRNQGAFLQMKRTAARLHQEHAFDAVFSFDLGGAGGLAWRLGRHLGVPATGWAFGLDVRVPETSSDAVALREMLPELDLVFYQSSELRACAESYLQGQKLDEHHVVFAHGIPPMVAPSDQERRQMRDRLQIPEEAVLVLFLSRVVDGKGIHELLTAFEYAADRHPTLHCIAVGETPGFDDSEALKAAIHTRGLERRFRLLPACQPERVRDYHAAADIFAFPSKSEGMPNALLESMAMGTPAVVFDIPPICDILAHGACLKAASCFDAVEFGVALSELAGSTERRSELAATARNVVTQHYDISRNMGQALAQVEALVS